ncbi:glycogen synthase GlgA [Acidomonas methanolica]|uniref:Glycogen synthase n=2 Tax=Acidomonas methanolica TaxID=437 RepID=A0A023D5N3_ACIMT|nr:glycogen synthase GlgA [Acidomonas methanolica]MBU2655612.1 glycogen synthase GlgA [Acidomonas methanolica]TCS21435.1 starch synthase [Acidomonas methanolica]GAJ29457.1 glycogen/starch synthase [Acidomonas methanolica NBRC 104435]GEL00372.1 glycogen synthase 2 [Acidomonas methanolica NBRC 104435]
MTDMTLKPVTVELQLLSVASEMYPFAKTGGLGDVVGSLPRALKQFGIATRTVLPGYRSVMAAFEHPRHVAHFPDVMGHPVDLWEGMARGHHLYAVDCRDLFDRSGGPYVAPDGHDWTDNGVRFAVLSRVASWIACGADPEWRPDVVQSHDWQAGLVPAFLRYEQEAPPPVAHVIHNLAFQGVFPREMLGAFGLPERAFTMEGVEYYGQISFMKAALQLADRIIAVSPTYAEEIQTPAEGMGLDGLLRARSDRLVGILNGIDLQEWNPASDPSVVFPYTVGDVVARRANKRAFQAEFDLPQDPDALLIGMASRLTTQKGADIVAEIAPRLFERPIQMAIIGTGDPAIMRSFTELRARYPRNLICHLRYSETLGHRLHSAVDATLVPSRFEPCGLTQFQALRYGSVPIAARVGGLSDTIVDANTAAIYEGVANGILFSPATPETLLAAIRRAKKLFQQKSVWARLQRNGALHDVSWEGKAELYARLFLEMTGKGPGKSELDGEIAPRRGDTAQRNSTAQRGMAAARMPAARAPRSSQRPTFRTGTHA